MNLTVKVTLSSCLVLLSKANVMICESGVIDAASKIRPLPLINYQMTSTIIYSLGVLFMLSLRFIISALQILLFAQHSSKVTNTQASSSKTTDAFSPSPAQ
jgi:hypothetical protein